MKFPVAAVALLCASFLFPNPSYAGVDAAISWGHGEVAVFSGSKVCLYNVRTAKAGPFLPIKDKIPGLWPTGIDAGFNNGRGEICFFKGDKFIVYNIKKGAINPGYPKTILGNFNGIWTERIGSSVMMGQRYLMLFRDTQYIRYDTYTGKVVPGYPKSIAGNVNGLTSGNGAACNWNGKLSFFTGDKWLRVSADCRTVDAGFPTKLPFTTPSTKKVVAKKAPLVSAAVYNSLNKKIYLFSGTKYYRYTAQTLALDKGYPLNTQKAFKLPWSTVDACLHNASGKGSYAFFKGTQTATFLSGSNALIKGHPRATTAAWPGVGAKGVGATFCTGGPNWRAYFYTKDSGLTFDMRRGYWKVEKSYTMTPTSPAVAKFWKGGIDALCKTPSYYFVFKGDKYAALNLKFQMLKGFPKPIKGNWKGL